MSTTPHDPHLEDDRAAFQRVADLYAQALAADALDLSFVPALHDALAALAADLGIDWTPPSVEVELVPLYHEMGVPVYYEGPRLKVYDATGKGWVSDDAPFVVSEKGHGKVDWFSTVEEAVEDAIRREETADETSEPLPASVSSRARAEEGPFRDGDFSFWNSWAWTPKSASKANAEHRAATAERLQHTTEKLARWGVEQTPEDVRRALDRLSRAEVGMERAILRAFELAPGGAFVGPSAAARTSQRKRDRADSLTRKANEELTRAREAYDRALGRYSPSAQAVIRSDDPNATERLDERIAELEKQHERMKAANVLIRRYKSDVEKGIAALHAELGFSEATARQLFIPDYLGRVGFADYALTNSTANIRRLKERAKGLARQATLPGERTWQADGVRIVDDQADKRVRLFFDERPDEALRSKLKSRAFKWSPKANAWQRLNTPQAIWDALRIVGLPIDTKPQGVPSAVAASPPERPPFVVPLNGMQDVAIVEKMPLNVRGVQMWRGYREGANVEVLFDPAGKEAAPGVFAIMQLEDLVASHHPDCSRNTAHRIAAAQPRDRSAKELCGQAETIARNLNPVAITGGVLAFEGAPVVTQEGYVVQGNGRAIALRVMYEKYGERASQYRRYLFENASKWGINKGDLDRARYPVLVRVITVTDGRAKHLGNIVNRSEAKLSRLDEAKSFVRRLSDSQRRQIGMTLAAAKADTLREMMDEVGLGLLDHLDGLDRTGMLRGGDLTVEAKDLLRDVFVGLVFDTDDNSGVRAYQAFPHATRSGIDKSLGYILPFIGTPYDLAPNLRGAALILHEMQAASGRFPNIAAYLDSADAFTGPARNRFSDEAAVLAHVLSTTTTQGEIVRQFQRYERLASGHTTLFETVPPATPLAAFAGAFNPMFRPNPEPCPCSGGAALAYFGVAEVLRVVDAKGKVRTFKNRLAFMTADGSRLVVVPRGRVQRIRRAPADKAAREQFERFHHYNASGKGFVLDLPDEAMRPLGTAKDIRYLSDKVMQPGDRKGRQNGYVHDFDTGKRPVALVGDVLIVDRLEISGRGILN